MPIPPLTSPDWSSVSDALQSPDQFLKWIEAALRINRTVKVLHSNGDVWPGMAAVIESDGKAHPYNTADPTHLNKYVGVVEGRESDGNLVRIITHGVLFNATLNWTIAAVYYIGGNGYLTTSLPSSSPRMVAVGVDSNRILIMPSPSTSGGGGTGDENIDGGTWNSVYLPSQLIDGGGF